MPISNHFCNCKVQLVVSLVGSEVAGVHCADLYCFYVHQRRLMATFIMVNYLTVRWYCV